MSRATRTIKLQDYSVKVITDLKWGEKEELQSVLFSGATVDQSGLKDFDPQVMFKAKIKLMEIAIQEIKDNDGKVVEFNEDWAKNLSAEDGDKLYEELEGLNKKKQS